MIAVLFEAEAGLQPLNPLIGSKRAQPSLLNYTFLLPVVINSGVTIWNAMRHSRTM